VQIAYPASAIPKYLKKCMGNAFSRKKQIKGPKGYLVILQIKLQKFILAIFHHGH
jgi:hypothetical protein